MLLERQIEKYLNDKIKAKNGLSFKFVSPGKRGVPDRIVIGQHRIVFVEVKKPGGVISPLQRKRAGQISALGHPVFFIWSYDDVDKFIREVWPDEI